MADLSYLAGSAAIAAAAVLGASDDELRAVLPATFGDRIACAIPADRSGLPADVQIALTELLDLFPSVGEAELAPMSDLRRAREAIVHLWRTARAAELRSRAVGA